MLRSFKNLELLRYYIGINFEKNFRAFAKQNEEKNEQLASTVFSTALSLIASFLSTKYIQFFSVPLNVAIILLVFVVGFIISYNVYICAYRKILRVKKSLKRYKRKTSAIEIKEIIDSFDHIACDNVLVAKEFMQHFDPQSDLELSTFYYFEIIYYAKTAAKKTLKILNNSNNCINSKDKTDAIDLFRIKNLCVILKQILQFISEHKGEISIDDKMRPSLDHQVGLLEQDITKAYKKCDGLIQNF